MPQNCIPVSVDDVLRFFEAIDGQGKRDGHPRNEGVPDSIRKKPKWKLCDLTEDEFMHLEIPDGTGTLIKDKTIDTLGTSGRTNVEERIQILESGNPLNPLIVCSRDFKEKNADGSSFYIEDGAKRAIAYKVYFEKHPYASVQAYIGTREA